MDLLGFSMANDGLGCSCCVTNLQNRVPCVFRKPSYS